MGDMDKNRPVISIDQKNACFRIYRRTLHILGDPSFVQLLVHPENRMMVICPVVHDGLMTHRIEWEKLTDKRKSFELRSCYFLRKLQEICKDWKENESYRIIGDIISSENIVRFDLRKTLPIVSEQEGSNA